MNTTAKTVTLTLASAVTLGDNVRVGYAKPGNNKNLTDAIGNEADALSNQAVTNNSARPTLTITGPTTETKDAFTVTFTFNKAVTGFVVGDVTVTRGTKGAFTETHHRHRVDPRRSPPTAEKTTTTSKSRSPRTPPTHNGVGNTAASKDFDVDTKAPVLSTATVDGNVLVLTYDETLGSANPGKDAYTVEERTGNTGSWDAVTVSSTAVNTTAKTVTLTLASAVTLGDNVRVGYAKPGNKQEPDRRHRQRSRRPLQPGGHQQLGPTPPSPSPARRRSRRTRSTRHTHVQPSRHRLRRHRRHRHPRFERAPSPRPPPAPCGPSW